MKKIKYPRYTREQNLACKLSEKDINKILYLYNKGLTRTKISAKLKIPYSLVWYWVLSQNERKQHNKKQYLSQKKNDIEEKRERQRRSKIRKYWLMPQFREYVRQRSKISHLVDKR